MDIQITNRRNLRGLKKRMIKQNLKKVLKDLACEDFELSVLFTDDQHISELNRDYLSREGPTNVLAFSMSPGPPPDVKSGMLGDVVISVDRAEEESKSLNEPFEETIYRLLIHGILHLLDYDHEDSKEEAHIMENKERELLSLIRTGV